MTRPAEWLWRGRVEAVGVFLPEGRGVLDAWVPGSRAWSWLGGVVVAWPEPVVLDVAHTRGLPLVNVGGTRCSGPFGPGADLAVGWHGEVHRADLAALAPYDPSAELPAPPPRLATTPLGPPPAPLTLATAQGVSVALGLGRLEVAPALVAEVQGRGVPAEPSWVARGAAWVAVALGWVAPAGHEGASRPVGPVGPGWGRRLASWLGLESLLQRLAQHRHGERVEELLSLFERDLDEALRRALPLGRQASGGPPGWEPWSGQPRELRFDRPRGGGGGGPAASEGLWDTMEAVYQRAFEQLDRMGRAREAAYVLGELLDKPLEAVAYLERHELFEEAAQLAEARRLPPELGVRLWARAGELDRAVRLARLHGCLGAVVAEVEARQEQELARVLRWAWARSRAAVGDAAGAAQILWPLYEGREQALDWLDQALEGDGVAAVQALVRRLVVRPDELEAVWGALTRIAEAPGPDGLQLRAELAARVGDLGPAGRSVALVLLPRMLREVGGADALKRKALEGLAAADPASRVDLPAFGPSPVPLADRAPILTRVARGDVGTVPILDAVGLDGGRVLVALGEQGVELLRSDGRRLRRWAVPSGQLVPLDGCGRALLLARRGEVVRGTWVDLVTGALTPWADGAWLGVASSGRGDGLWAWDAERLVLLDPLADGRRALWSVAMEVAALTRAADATRVFARDRGEWTVFDYEKVRLVRRRSVEVPDGAAPVDVDEHGVWFAGPLGLACAPGRAEGFAPGVDRVSAGRWACVVAPEGEAWTLQLEASGRRVWREERPSRPRARLFEGRWTVWDAEGRVRVVDLDLGATLADLRR